MLYINLVFSQLYISYRVVSNSFCLSIILSLVYGTCDYFAYNKVPTYNLATRSTLTMATPHCKTNNRFPDVCQQKPVRKHDRNTVDT